MSVTIVDSELPCQCCFAAHLQKMILSLHLNLLHPNQVDLPKLVLQNVHLRPRVQQVRGRVAQKLDEAKMKFDLAGFSLNDISGKPLKDSVDCESFSRARLTISQEGANSSLQRKISNSIF